MATIERKLATIKKIDDILSIEGADRIEVLIIGGWKVVAKKGEFQKGDLCIYVEIDSILPDHPEFEFLRDKKFRIKTIKLRGVTSQGIAFPLSILKSFVYYLHDKNNMFAGKLGYATGIDVPGSSGTNGLEFTEIVEGLDVTDVLGIKKYEYPIPASLSGSIRGEFPSQVPRTDEERIQNFKPEDYDKIRNVQLVETEKLDGSSFSAILIDNDFQICSRRMNLKESEDNTLWKLARKYKLEEKMKGYHLNNFAIQGEIIGEGIQKNNYELRGQDLYVFNAYNIDTNSYLEWDELKQLIKDLELKSVPIINENFVIGDKTVFDLIEYVDNTKSILNPKKLREGSVFKAIINDKYGNRQSFKILSNTYDRKHS